MEFGGIARLIIRADKAFVAAVNSAAAGVGLAVRARLRLDPGVRAGTARARVQPHRAAARGGHELAAHPPGRLPAHLRAVRRRPALSGEEAAAFGLANTVVTHEALLDAATD
jgi:hypothetical protein